MLFRSLTKSEPNGALSETGPPMPSAPFQLAPMAASTSTPMEDVQVHNGAGPSDEKLDDLHKNTETAAVAFSAPTPPYAAQEGSESQYATVAEVGESGSRFQTNSVPPPTPAASLQ